MDHVKSCRGLPDVQGDVATEMEGRKTGIHVSYEDVGTNDMDCSQGLRLKLFAFCHFWHCFVLLSQ